MPLKHKVGTTWKDVVVWHKVGSTWKKVAVHHKVGSVWKQITTLIGAALTNRTIYGGDPSSPYSATGTFSLLNTGAGSLSCTGASDQNFTWLTGGAASDFECRAVLVSGSTPSGTMSTWLALSSARSWSITRTTVGISQSVFDVTIRDVATAGATVSVTGRVTITIENGNL